MLGLRSVGTLHTLHQAAAASPQDTAAFRRELRKSNRLDPEHFVSAEVYPRLRPPATLRQKFIKRVHSIGCDPGS